MIPEEIEEIKNKAFNEARTFRRNLIKQNNRLNQRMELFDIIREELQKKYPTIMGYLKNWQDTAMSEGAHTLKMIELVVRGGKGNFEDISKEVCLGGEVEITGDLIREYIEVVAWNQECYNYKYYNEREGKVLYRGIKHEESRNKPLQSFTSKEKIANKFGYHKRECKVTMDDIRFIPELLPSKHYYNEREFIISKEEA